jgi:hypothetical protein
VHAHQAPARETRSWGYAPVFTSSPAPTRCSAPPTARSRPSTRWSTRSPRPRSRPRSPRTVGRGRQEQDRERTTQAADAPKTGVFTGAYAVNPVTGKHIPVWIADYVLASYGTGAVFACAAHDERDHAFAKKFDLPIVEVVQGGDVASAAYVRRRPARVGDFLTGCGSLDAKTRVIAWLDRAGLGSASASSTAARLAVLAPALLGRAVPDIVVTEGPEAGKVKCCPTARCRWSCRRSTSTSPRPTACRRWRARPSG